MIKSETLTFAEEVYIFERQKKKTDLINAAIICIKYKYPSDSNDIKLHLSGPYWSSGGQFNMNNQQGRNHTCACAK